jgi:hypothetical protein
LRVLGGEWRNGSFVVERRFDASTRHGRVRVGDLAHALASAAGDAALLAGGAVYGAFPRDRAFLGFAVAVGSSASSFALSRRFD